MNARLRAALPFLVLLSGLLVVVLVSREPPAGPPLDPTSTGPLGTKASMELLRGLGTDVRIVHGIPERGVPRALVLEDAFDDAQRQRLLAWVRDGGVLVVADPDSPLQPDIVGTTDAGLVPATIARACDVTALRDVERVDVAGAVVYAPPAGATACFPRAPGAWLILQDEGDGALVLLGGPQPFLNEELSSADNGLLVAALLGDRRVAVVQPPAPGSGEATLADLLPDHVRLAFLQLLVALAIVVAARARRLGQPVREPAAVAVPGSELVVAVGDLFQTTRSRGHAAHLLRDDLRRDLAGRLGLGADSTVEQIVETARTRAGVDPVQLRPVLSSDGIDSDDALVRLARDVEEARQRLRSGSASAS